VTAIKPAARQHFSDGSSYNPNLGTITFGLTLPAEIGESMLVNGKPSAKPILNCLARSIETQQNPLAKSALKAVFDCIYDRSTPEEREFFPNWFDSQ
jgi:hypothetical protein